MEVFTCVNTPLIRDSELSVTHRKKGNDFYKDKRLHDALEEYNKSILLGQWKNGSGSLLSPEKELAFSFGNRSAVLVELGEYELAIGDITVALTADVPVITKRRLLLRKLRCLLGIGISEYKLLSMKSELKRFSEVLDPSDKKAFMEQIEKEKVRSINHDVIAGEPSCDFTCDNPSLAGASRKVKVAFQHHCGRHLVAQAMIRQGEVLIAEDPYAFVVNDQFRHAHCGFCCSRHIAPFPCYRCTHALYCSKECMEKAWSKYHWFECSKSLKVNWMVLLGLRVLLASDPVKVNKFIFDKRRDLSDTVESKFGDDYPSVHSLVTNEDATPKALIQELEHDIGALLSSPGQSLLGHFDTNQQEVGGVSSEGRGNHRDEKERTVTTETLGHLILHHSLQVKYNTLAVTALLDCTGGTGSSTVESRAHTRLGYGIYPSASLLNHSCNPNTIVRFAGTHLKIVAIRDIHPGEEVSLCYGPHYLRMTKSKRQEVLKTEYAFSCKCTACDRDKDTSCVSDAIRCPKCSQAVPLCASDPSPVAVCSECGCILAQTELQDIIKQCGVADALFDEAKLKMATRKQWQECIAILCDCLDKRQTLLYRYNKKLGETHDCLAQVFAEQGDFVRAARHCKESVNVVEGLFGSNSIELAHEMHKLAQLLFNSKQIDDAIVAVEKAIKLLLLFNEKDKDVVELEAMLDCLLQAR